MVAMKVLIVGLASQRHDQPSLNGHGGVWLANGLLTQALIRSGADVYLLTSDDGTPVLPEDLETNSYTLISYIRPRVPQALAKRLGPGTRLVVLRSLEDMFLKRAMLRALRSCSSAASLSHVIFLGSPPLFCLKNVPTISYLQSLPWLELQALWRGNLHLVRAGGILKLLGLSAYQCYRMVLDRLRTRRADMLIVASEILTKHVRHKNCKVLRYPIASGSTASQPRTDSTARLLWLGRIVPRKRFDLLCQAFTILKQRGLDISLRIIGGFSAFPELKSLLDNHPYQSHIIYTPHLPHQDAMAELNSSTILIQTSDNEVMGSAIPEALARGAQVVLGRRNGTLPEGHPAGTWFTEYRAEKVADAIEVAISRINNPGHSQASVKAFKELFDQQKLSEEFVRIVTQTNAGEQS